MFICTQYKMCIRDRNSRESVKWHYDERYFERELCFDRKIQLFEVSRSYKELRVRVKIERVDDYIEFLPGDVVSAARGDNNVDDLPVYKMRYS